MAQQVNLLACHTVPVMLLHTVPVMLSIKQQAMSSNFTLFGLTQLEIKPKEKVLG